MKCLVLTILAALSLGGCTTAYKWDTDKKGNVYLAGTSQRFDPDKAAAIAGTVVGTTLAVAAVGAELGSSYYGGVSDYYATHPTVYVQPSYVAPYQTYQPYQPQHGTATITPMGIDHPIGAGYNINY
jgi:uncharacterized protein YceK